MKKEDFIKEFEKRFNLKLEKTNEIRDAKKVYFFEKNEESSKCYFYIKESNIDEPFWGFTDTIISRLEETKLPYFLVLLSNENNYCFSSEKVIELRQNLSYSPTGNEKGEFKLTLPYLNDYDNCKLNFDILRIQIVSSKEILATKEDIIRDKCQVIADIVNHLSKKHSKYSEITR